MNDTSLLLELAQRLESSGNVVVRFKDHLEMRLPLFAHVKIRINDGRLSCEPRFGFLPRDRATWATILGLAALTVTAFLDHGITPLSMALGFLTTSSGASTAIRYQVTEACITRVQTAFMLLQASSALAAPIERNALHEPSPRSPQMERDAIPLERRKHKTPPA